MFCCCGHACVRCFYFIMAARHACVRCFYCIMAAGHACVRCFYCIMAARHACVRCFYCIMAAGHACVRCFYCILMAAGPGHACVRCFYCIMAAALVYDVLFSVYCTLDVATFFGFLSPAIDLLVSVRDSTDGESWKLLTRSSVPSHQ